MLVHPPWVREINQGHRSIACIIILVSLLLLATATHKAWGAAGELKYELVSGGVTYGDDAIITGLKQAIFHQQDATAVDLESLGIAFPGTLCFAPSQGTGIALPSIRQTREESASRSSTGFYSANQPYYPYINEGAAPIGVGQFGRPSPVTPAGFQSNSLLYPEMVVEGDLTPNLTYDNKNINNSRVTLPPSTAGRAYGETAAALGGTTGMESSPLALSIHRFNLDLNASQISRMSILERMWRNSHLSHLMDIAFEGEVSRPAWISPEETLTVPQAPRNESDLTNVTSPRVSLQRTDHAKVIREALAFTRPGQYIKPEFWDLNPLTPGRLVQPVRMPAGQAIHAVSGTSSGGLPLF